MGDMWRRMAWEKFGQEWFDACEADESILYYEHPQPNYDKWYLRLRDRDGRAGQRHVRDNHDHRVRP